VKHHVLKKLTKCLVYQVLTAQLYHKSVVFILFMQFSIFFTPKASAKSYDT